MRDPEPGSTWMGSVYGKGEREKWETNIFNIITGVHILGASHIVKHI